MKWCLRLLVVGLMSLSFAHGQGKPRARDLGVPFEGTPGRLNAITDVAGIEVGNVTLIAGSGKLVPGQGPVRTGVTAILPRGKSATSRVFAGWFSQNGNGEMTGTTWIEESGILEGPIILTNTHSVGVARDAVIQWRVRHHPSDPDDDWWSLPVVAETWDGYLNDINGFHVHPAHVFEALDTARSGPVPEGNVGGGTGMICHEFKGGIGTASRSLEIDSQRLTVGVLVQANYGLRRQLRIAGVPVGLEIPGNLVWSREEGSIIVVVATDAPLLPHQLKRLARRATMGVARMGGTAGNGSGRHLHRLLHGQRGGRLQHRYVLPANAGQRPPRSNLRGRCPGHGRVDRECPRGRGNHGRARRPPRGRPPP